MRHHPRPEDVDAFGNRPPPAKRARPRKINANLREVPTRHLYEFIEKLAEAEERFEAYKRGEASLEMMATAPGARRHFLAQDQVNTWLRRQLLEELRRRGAV